MKKKSLFVFIVMMCVLISVINVYADTNNYNEIKEFNLTLLQEGGFPDVAIIEDNDKDVSADIKNALYNREYSIEIDYSLENSNELAKLYENLINNSPELYYVLGSVQIQQVDKYKYILYPRYREETISLFAANGSSAAVNDILAQIDDEMTDVEKALAVHDYMLLNYEYDKTYSIYDADTFFTSKRGVCQAYALAFEYIMNKLGITCTVVSSEAMNHAWNMIRVNGNWYHIDVTWDDPGHDTYGAARHEFFMLSDDAISDDQHWHYDWDSSKKATDTTYDSYFWTHINSPLEYYAGDWYWTQDYSCSYDGISINAGVSKYSLKDNTITNVLSPKKFQFVAQNIHNGYMYLMTEYFNLYMVPMNNLSESNIVQAASYRYLKEYGTINEQFDILNGWYIDNGYFYYAIADAQYYEEDDDGVAIYNDYYEYRHYYSIEFPRNMSNNTKRCGNNLTWELDDEGTLTISGSGDMWGWSYYDNTPWQEYNDSIKTVLIGKRVTSIGAYAFYGCGNLTSVEMPNTIMNIGDNAFSNCSSLSNVKIPDAVKNVGGGAFTKCSSLKTITLPDGITNIETSTFNGCSRLESIAIPNSVVNIGNSAFGSCQRLNDVYYSGTESQWNNISIYEMGNYYINNATVHYESKGIPTEITVAELLSSGNEYKFNVSFADIPYNCELITVLYKENKEIAGINITKITPFDNKASVTVTADEIADYAKVFIWSNLEDLKPLCSAKIISIQ